MNQWNRIQNPERNPHKSIFDKGGKDMGNGQKFLQQVVLRKLDSCM